ncbi:MAG: cell division protein SepF [Acidimicrobiia bacterium]
MRRVTEYLGLAPDEEYDDVEDYDDRDERTGPARAAGRATPMTRPTAVVPEMDRSASVRALPVQPVRPTMVTAEDDDRDRVVARPQSTGPVVVRPAADRVVARPQVVSPTSFAAAQEVADKFKANRPVIMNLQGLDRDLRRRLIDFASGLCYGLGGQMDKVADHVFLLTPPDVQVPEEDRRRLSERDFDDAR